MDTPFSDLLQSLEPDGEGTYTSHIPDLWMQGRSTYGGLSAAIALEAALKALPDLPPLRSAQITFVGPIGGNVQLKVEELRRGKSVVYVNVDVIGEKGLGTRAVFAFGTLRPSQLDHQFLERPNVPQPEALTPFFRDGLGPSFGQNFDARLAAGEMPFSGSQGRELTFWTKFHEETPPSAVGLLAIADMPPPAISPMFPGFAPLSSMTWMINIVVEELTTEDGWWLQRTRAEHAQNGYSSQDMIVWNSHGDPVMVSRQNVAIFV